MAFYLKRYFKFKFDLKKIEKKMFPTSGCLNSPDKEDEGLSFLASFLSGSELTSSSSSSSVIFVCITS